MRRCSQVNLEPSQTILHPEAIVSRMVSTIDAPPKQSEGVMASDWLCENAGADRE
jgi:hypothetical protein